MRKYLAYYETEWPANIAELTAVENKPFVGYLKGEGVLFTVIPKPIVYDPYVTFTAEQANSTIGLVKLSTNQTLEYSRDGSNWSNMNTRTNISLNNGDKVYVRGMLSSDNTYEKYTQFKMSGKIAAFGNCNAIWNYQDLEAPLKLYCGYSMFKDCTSLTAAPVLPATELANSCYSHMFYNCTSLISAPELPAIALAKSCYSYMLYGCTGLTTAPELPATELTNNCYFSMFYGCTSLKTAPELPATELAEYCYTNMFSGCTSLITAPKILPATTLVLNCYKHMFYNCTSLITAPELPATELANNCYYSMFNNCTSLITAPELPATMLIGECYKMMFYGCTNLNYIKCLATNALPYYSTSSWVYQVSSTGTFVKHPDMNSWTTGSYGIPSGWTVEDAVL